MHNGLTTALLYLMLVTAMLCAIMITFMIRIVIISLIMLSIKEILNSRHGQLPAVHRWIMSVSGGQRSKKVRFKQMIKGCYCNWSFYSGMYLIPYLEWIAAEGRLTTLSIHVSDLQKLLAGRAQSMSRPAWKQNIIKVSSQDFVREQSDLKFNSFHHLAPFYQCDSNTQAYLLT